MRTKTVQLYKFDELSDKAKERARDWYAQSSSCDNWWSECVLDNAKTILEKLGFREPDIYWNGFCSQGDGACFEGKWFASYCRPLEVKAEYGDSELELQRIADKFATVLVRCKLVVGAEPMARLSHNGRSCHENSVNFEFYWDDGDDNDYADYTDYNEVIEEASRDLMRWIYSALETEYNYQTSEEQIDEQMRINEYEFTQEGLIA